jgi:hypothetical protein
MNIKSTFLNGDL